MTYDQMLLAEIDASEARQKYLAQRGWKNTSNTPGCLWMWEKTLPDGRTLLVDVQSAIRAESLNEPQQEG